MWRTRRWSKQWVTINCFKTRNHCKSSQNSVHRPSNNPKIKQGLMHKIFIEILEGERCLHSLFNTVSWTRKMSTASQLGKKISSQLVTPIYIGDESWELQYDPETKHQSMDWWTKSPSRPMCMFIICIGDVNIIEADFKSEATTWERQLASFAQQYPTHSAVIVKCILANDSIPKAMPFTSYFWSLLEYSY